MPKDFSRLSEREILALAISLEEEDERVYADYAETFAQNYPDSSALFRKMSDEESGHRHRLLELYQSRFGNHLPLMRRQDVKGFVNRKNPWLNATVTPEEARKQAAIAEMETLQFYRKAALQTRDAGTRQLLDDLAKVEEGHGQIVSSFESSAGIGQTLSNEESTRKRLFVLQVVQPGLAGLMDGSVSTLAPVFAAAFATQDSLTAFKVGLAASVGAGISMGFAEALSDDGSLSGRGRPYIRGSVCGLMTALGGIGHTLPFLIPDFRIATAVAVVVVIVELIAIAWIRKNYMDTPFLSAAFQVIVGGLLVFATGVLIGGG
ncbi:ferritin family protein [Kamptonema cortianum]|nr:ferritin family protein [Kamptonema cortianum]MDL5049737.1 ferritin family protein [Oscillatoria amoena NRMC-F 0135]